MENISRTQLETVTGGTTVPGGPSITGQPNWTNGAREGWRGWTDSRSQGQGIPQAGWNAAKRGFQGLWR